MSDSEEIISYHWSKRSHREQDKGYFSTAPSFLMIHALDLGQSHNSQQTALISSFPAGQIVHTWFVNTLILPTTDLFIYVYCVKKKLKECKTI